MCGLAGLISSDPRAGRSEQRREDVALMLSTLEHRGPDGCGIESLEGAALGHRRLAIIDLSRRAAQPMPLRCAAPDTGPAIWLVANGEIYNYVELRAGLEDRGHRFRSDGDIEVILHLYEERGPGCTVPLRGMFAFALWDAPRRRLLLARDRMGQKPLYYRIDGDGIAFASESKAITTLARARGESVEPDASALRSYLALKYVPGPSTAVRGIRRLPPAHMMLYEAGTHEILPYWRLPDAISGTRPLSPAERRIHEEEMRESMRESVRLRLRSDVPLGLFLSGGLDSGILAALMLAEMAGTASQLQTFTVSLDRSDYDEARLAARTARALGAAHHEIAVRPTPEQTTDLLPALAWHLDQPFADSSAVAVHHLAREVRRHVTVALSGDGADELFLGYDRYRAHRLAERLGPSLSGAIRRIAAPFLRSALRVAAGRRNLKGRALRFLDACGLPTPGRNDAWVSCIDPDLASRILTGGFLEAMQGEDPLEALHRCYGAGGREASLESIQRADLLTYLPDDILHKVDAATMSHALETRAPFLDHHVIERAMRIPTPLKLASDGPGKRILREIFGRDLPQEVAQGRKTGFVLPLDHWLRRDLAGYCRDVLMDPATLSRGILRRDGVAALLEEHRTGTANREDAIWALVMLEHWFRAVVDAGHQRVSICEGVAVG